jgi:GNAT superfamily N-acetyltransferase
MEILQASAEDAPAILAICHAAFRPVADDYGETTLPPLEETLEDLLGDFGTHVILKAVEDGTIVGSVRGALFEGTCEVGRLVVAPGVQGRGVGSALAREIETYFPEAERFELFTGHRSGPSLHIYQGLGYLPFRVEPVTERLQLVFLEKPGSERREG